MISVFIFKSNARGMQYGIGTYIKELSEALISHTDVNVYIINYHSAECKEYTIEKVSPKYTKISLPTPRSSSAIQKDLNLYEKRYASSIVNLLSNLISKNGKVIFQINYIDGLPLIKKLKERYSHPVISVVHFAQWQELFNGNKIKLRGLNIDKPSNNIEYTLSLEKEMYELSDRIISVTSYMKDFLINEYGIKRNKIDVITNGLNVRQQIFSNEEKEKLKHKLGFKSDEKIVLFCGRIDPSKGIFFLLEAFVEACKILNNIRLVVVGQGDIQECLQKYQLFYGKITFTGFLTQKQIMPFYQIADVGVNPSVYDHCPYTILEMMSNKIPLIISKINGLDEILNEEECIFIEPEIDIIGNFSLPIQKLANAIIHLTNNESIANALSEVAYLKVLSKHSILEMGKNTFQTFEKAYL